MPVVVEQLGNRLADHESPCFPMEDAAEEARKRDARAGGYDVGDEVRDLVHAHDDVAEKGMLIEQEVVGSDADEQQRLADEILLE